jgi:hypothetical protein
MLEEIRTSLEAETAYAELRYPYFFEKRPGFGTLSMMSYDCGYIVKSGKAAANNDVSVSFPSRRLPLFQGDIRAWGS